jgi:glutamyl-tRNA reductase
MPPTGINELEQADSFESTDTAGNGDAATGAALARLRSALNAIQQAELERLYDRLPMLSDQSRHEIHQFSDRLVATVLDPPLKVLSEESSAVNASTLLDSLRRLFQLH